MIALLVFTHAVIGASLIALGIWLHIEGYRDISGWPLVLGAITLLLSFNWRSSDKENK